MEHVILENASTTTLDRKAKLLRWADLVRKHKGRLDLFHNLEHMSTTELRNLVINRSELRSALTVAVKDPVFNAAGLSPNATVYDAMGFFRLSKAELHDFSCDCGGEITPAKQSARIAELAG